MRKESVPIGPIWSESQSVPFSQTNETHKNLYDEEYTVVYLGDWYHNQHSGLDARFLSEGNPGGAEPVSDNDLIYVPPIAGKPLLS